MMAKGYDNWIHPPNRTPFIAPPDKKSFEGKFKQYLSDARVRWSGGKLVGLEDHEKLPRPTEELVASWVSGAYKSITDDDMISAVMAA